MFSLLKKGFILFLFLVMGLNPAFADIGTTAMLVSVNVEGDCMITAAPLVFGLYNPDARKATRTTSRLRVLCTLNTPYNITMDQGAGITATTRLRTMSGPRKASIRYTLSQNPTHTINWGNTLGTDTKVGKGSGLTQFVVVYGEIPPKQNVGIGAYHDVVNVNIIF